MAGGDHPLGRAVDIMVSGAPGWDVAEYVRANYARLGVSYVIYAQKIWSVQRGGEGWRGMSDRGSVTANHSDHVHMSTYWRHLLSVGATSAQRWYIDHEQAPFVPASSHDENAPLISSLPPAWNWLYRHADRTWRRVSGGDVAILARSHPSAAEETFPVTSAEGCTPPACHAHGAPPLDGHGRQPGRSRLRNVMEVAS